MKYTDLDDRIVIFLQRFFFMNIQSINYPDPKNAFLGVNVWLNQEDKKFNQPPKRKKRRKKNQTLQSCTVKQTYSTMWSKSLGSFKCLQFQKITTHLKRQQEMSFRTDTKL